MERKFRELAEKLKSTKGDKEVSEVFSEVETLLQQNPLNTYLLHLRAEIYIKLQQPAKAINDYNHILNLNPEDSVARFQVSHLKTILKFSNTDIYANPNTNLDPWLD